ncbi:MAG: hypothetical protein ABFE16_18070 [Armatimonadia bacterium]
MRCLPGLLWVVPLFLVLLIPMAFALAADDDAAERTAAAMPELQPLQTPMDFFPILPWEPLLGHDGAVDAIKVAAGIAECNFTMAGFVKPADLPACEANGLKALVYGTANRGPLSRDEWKQLSDEEIDAFFKQAVADAGNSEAILGYYLVDEPGAGMFAKLAVGVAAVKKYAPGKLAYINLYPGYATIGAPDTSQLQTPSFHEYLERFVTEVRPQVISYDDYMVQYSMDLTVPGPAARYFTDLMEVRAVARKYGLPFWNIVSGNQVRAKTTIPSPANLALQAYTTLAAGGRGVTWYTYSSRGYGYAAIDKQGNRTMTYQYLQMVNRQVKTLGPIMTGLESKGVYFTAPAPMESAPVLPGEFVSALKSDAPAMIGEFVSPEGTAYVMVVNLSLQKSSKIALDLQTGHQGATVISAEDGSELQMEEGNALWLTAGQGALLKLR